MNDEYLNKIIKIDCIEGMKLLDTTSIDVIIADPPYNIGKDFGNNISKKEIKDYIDWSLLWINEASRTLNESGTMFIYGFSEILAHISVNIDLPHRWLIWHYTNKNVPTLKFWQRSHEAILCIWKDKPFFNLDDVREEYTESFLKNAAGKQRKNTKGRFSTGNKTTTYNAHNNGALPRDVIKTPALAGGAGRKERWFYCNDCCDSYEPKQKNNHEKCDLVIHPTQKPESITLKLIKSAINKEKINNILVPFAGSGVECIVSKRQGHNFIGFEINPDYIDLATSRINKTDVNARLFN